MIICERMIERRILEMFEGKVVGILHVDSGEEYWLKGKIKEITDSSVTVKHPNHGLCSVSVDSIEKIKEVKGDSINNG